MVSAEAGRTGWVYIPSPYQLQTADRHRKRTGGRQNHCRSSFGTQPITTRFGEQLVPQCSEKSSRVTTRPVVSYTAALGITPGPDPLLYSGAFRFGSSNAYVRIPAISTGGHGAPRPAVHTLQQAISQPGCDTPTPASDMPRDWLEP